MDRNPYAPPEAQVADPSPERPIVARPLTVTRAVQLMWVAMGLGVVNLVFSWETLTALEDVPALAAFLLGTDATGRDILSRILHGGRVSLVVAGISTLLGLILGTVLGILNSNLFLDKLTGRRSFRQAANPEVNVFETAQRTASTQSCRKTG